MSEEVSVEELQKQILEMKEANEKTAVEMQNLKESLSKSEDSLKAARELNAKLMSKVPGEDDASDSDKPPADPYEGLSQEEMLSKLGDHHFGLLFRSGKCMLAKYDAEGKDPIWNLDTYIAQEVILNGIYKADEGKSSVSYDAEIDSVLRKMYAKEYDVAIILNHPSLKSIWDLALIGKKMPKKTTFFFPKIWSGFVFYKMA